MNLLYTYIATWIKYIIICSLYWNTAFAQNYLIADSIPVIEHGVQLGHPFTGGFNNVQYNNTDLNGDGVKDLLLYDRGNQKILPFLVLRSQQTVTYKYSPEHEALFPNVENFMLLRDYNGDGYEDLFVGADLGLQVYRCVVGVTGLRYELVTALYSAFQGRPGAIMINPEDYPLVQDMDKDGDLDLVCFDYYSGARLEYHQNLSVERFGHRDSLIFQQTDDCYANFQEIACDTFAFGLNCRLLRKSRQLERIQHVGAGAILSWDLDHDGLEDLLISKSDCQWINFLKNVGSASQAVFEPRLRRFGTPTDTFMLKGYPVAYAVDVDASGIRDLVLSPRATSSNYRIDFEASSFLFNSDLTVATSSFLQSQTIDLGENSTPFKYDYDNDGDQDLFVGYHTYVKEEKYRGGIALYENIMSESRPLFRHKTSDYMGLMSRQWVNVQPQFFDINSDGNMDLLVTASLPLDILDTRTFVYYGDQVEYYRFNDKVDTLLLPLNIMDAPFFTRAQSGHVEALIGKSNGTVLRYMLQDKEWTFEGQLWASGPNEDQRYACVREANIDGDAEADLLLSNSKRYLLWIKNYKTQAIGAWSLDTLQVYHKPTARLNPVRLMSRPMLSSTFSPSQKSEIWVGGASGGLIVLRPDYNTSHMIFQGPEVFPNPFNNQLLIKASMPDAYRLYDYQGRFLASGSVGEGYTVAPFENLHSGLYILRFSHKSVLVVKE